MEFWSHIIKMAVATGMPAPQDTSAFLATGALSWYTVISNFHSGIFFIGWRCLYAASVKSRIDNKPLDLEAALKRTVAMIIGRLKAYGGKWKRWIAKTRHQRKPGVIPRNKQNKKVMTQNAHGEYTIHRAILEKAEELGLSTP